MNGMTEDLRREIESIWKSQMKINNVVSEIKNDLMSLIVEWRFWQKRESVSLKIDRQNYTSEEHRETEWGK